MSFILRDIECSEIIVGDDYPRQSGNQAFIPELAESLDDVGGIFTPILVGQTVDNEFYLIKGLRRILANQRKGNSSIIANVITELSLNDIARFRAIAHLSTEKLSPLEIAKQLNHVRFSLSLTYSQLSKWFGWGDHNAGRQRVGYYIRLLELPPDVLEYFSGPECLPITMASQLLRLSDDHASLLWATQKASKDQLSLRELTALIDELESYNRSNVAAKEKVEKVSFDPGALDEPARLLAMQYGVDLKVKLLRSGKISVRLESDSDTKIKSLLDFICTVSK